jgi:hypothetical protein
MLHHETRGSKTDSRIAARRTGALPIGCKRTNTLRTNFEKNGRELVELAEQVAKEEADRAAVLAAENAND